MVFAVMLAEPDSFGSGTVQGCPKMAQHLFTGSPCHQCPPQASPSARWIPKGADVHKMQYPCFHIALVFQELCPS